MAATVTLCLSLNLTLGIFLDNSNVSIKTHGHQEASYIQATSTEQPPLTTTDIPTNVTHSQYPLLFLWKGYLDGVVTPALCVFGIIGNALNIIVLTRRKCEKIFSDHLEYPVYFGFLTLAISDMCYSVCALVASFSHPQALFTEKSFGLYHQLYGSCFTNLFFHTSTWLTVNIALGRFAAICHPFHAKQIIGVTSTNIIVISIFVVVILLQLPMFWTYKVTEIQCSTPGLTLYILDQGYFVRNNMFKIIFTYFWSIFGFLIPVVILTFCNTKLICALKSSYNMRRGVSRIGNNLSQKNQITLTLISIVILFVLLVSPSEIIKLYFFAIDEQNFDKFSFGMSVTNCLHTVNFSMNFVLYCIANKHFRITLKKLFECRYAEGCYPAMGPTKTTNSMTTFPSYRTMVTLGGDHKTKSSGSVQYESQV